MSTIRPFPAIRYATGPTSRDISTRLAPPYDVLDRDDKQALLRPDGRNFVQIDLPHIPPKSAGPPEAYAASRQQLEAWLADGTMVQDAQPACYVYHQSYAHGGVDYVRKMFFARLRIEPFGTGSVFPHERTFGGPKEDRLCLTKATRTNLSPIFGLYEDAENVVTRRFERALASEPLAVGTLDGVENRLWSATDPETIAEIASLMVDKPIYIADGHHRYETAALYRDWLSQQEGPLPEEHPANSVLCVFCAMEDPGLLILPTHRVLPGVSVGGGLLREDERLEVARLPVENAAEVPQALARFGPQAVGVYHAAGQGCLMARPKQPGILDDLEPERAAAWRALGVAFLHAYLLDRVVAPQLCDRKAPELRYVKAAQAAVAAARESKGTAFLMQATTMEELRSVCQAGEVMPQKSTYFYPKLASGLVINPLAE
ncbi:MAG: DUF1015 domain-containing protein [Phycisphaerae bacterium]